MILQVKIKQISIKIHEVILACTVLSCVHILSDSSEASYWTENPEGDFHSVLSWNVTADAVFYISD